MLIPTRMNKSRGRLAPSPFEFEPARASVDGAVVRGVAVAPRIPPDLVGEGLGVPFEGLGEELGGELGEGLGEGLGGWATGRTAPSRRGSPARSRTSSGR
jgi:hypothetical protein